MKAIQLKISELKSILEYVEKRKETNDNGVMTIAENGSVRVPSGYAECNDIYVGKFDIKGVNYTYSV